MSPYLFGTVHRSTPAGIPAGTAGEIFGGIEHWLLFTGQVLLEILMQRSQQHDYTGSKETKAVVVRGSAEGAHPLL